MRGFEVFTESRERHCAKCETKMIFICNEYEYKKGGKLNE